MKKKFIHLCSLLLALTMVLSMSVVAKAEGEEDLTENLNTIEYVRVGLFWGTNGKDKVTLESADGFNLYDEDGEFLEHIDDKTLNIDDSSGYIAHREGRIFMSAAEDPDSRIVTLSTDSGKKQYRDGIYLYENSGFRVINYVTLEHYVWGVVNKEMSATRPLEALKAQAVAARTYVMRNKYQRLNTPESERSGHAHYGFDVCTTTDCQVYGAYASEQSNSTLACMETEGLIMVYDDEPIRAYFSASSGGGYTMSLYDAWGQDDVPYLKSVEDPYSSVHNWEFYNTMPEIQAKILNYYKKDIGSVRKVEVTKTNSFGAVTQITVTGSKSTVIVPRSQLMALFNLKSTFFCIANDGYGTIESLEQRSNNELDSYYVMNADGSVTALASGLVYVTDGETVSRIELFETEASSALYHLENEVCTDAVYWRGMGFGHGIGMQQTGAYNMAEQGMRFDTILNFYYSDIDIVDYTEVIDE